VPTPMESSYVDQQYNNELKELSCVDQQYNKELKDNNVL